VHSSSLQTQGKDERMCNQALLNEVRKKGRGRMDISGYHEVAFRPCLRPVQRPILELEPKPGQDGALDTDWNWDWTGTGLELELGLDLWLMKDWRVRIGGLCYIRSHQPCRQLLTARSRWALRKGVSRKSLPNRNRRFKRSSSVYAYRYWSSRCHRRGTVFPSVHASGYPVGRCSDHGGISRHVGLPETPDDEDEDDGTQTGERTILSMLVSAFRASKYGVNLQIPA